MAELQSQDNVKLHGNQTIDGVKSFNDSPIVPTPADPTEAANKDYVDSAVSAITGDFVPYTGAATNLDMGANDVLVLDEAYGAGWDGSLEVPTKNALYDKIQTLTAPTYITGTAVLAFASEENNTVLTVLSAAVTAANFKGFAYMPIGTTATSLDDFTLNGVTMTIENIVDGVSFDIRASSVNNATGDYTINYQITTI